MRTRVHTLTQAPWPWLPADTRRKAPSAFSAAGPLPSSPLLSPSGTATEPPAAPARPLWPACCLPWRPPAQNQPPPATRRAPASPSPPLQRTREPVPTCPAPVHPAHSQLDPQEADGPHLPPEPSMAPHCPNTGRGPRPPWHSCHRAAHSSWVSPFVPPSPLSPPFLPSPGAPWPPLHAFLSAPLLHSLFLPWGRPSSTEHSLCLQTAAPSVRASGGYSTPGPWPPLQWGCGRAVCTRLRREGHPRAKSQRPLAVRQVDRREGGREREGMASLRRLRGCEGPRG